jgi:hypothetical protein
MPKSRFFDPGVKTRSSRNKRIYAVYELWYTIVDVAAALSFVAGSFLFLSESTQNLATWLFIVGSIFFLMKPVIRLMREAGYLADGDVDVLAKRAGWTSKDE